MTAKLSRRNLFNTLAAGTVIAASASPGEPENAGARVERPRQPDWQALHLEKGRHLFVDDSLIAETRNLTTTLHHPQKHGAPLLGGVGSPADNSQPFATILYDDRLKRFRMWYNTRKSLHSQTCVSYIESEDGIHWDPPYKELFEIYGFGCCVTDMGPDYPDPQRRYKMIYWGLSRKGASYLTDGHAAERVAFSPDGLKWDQYEGNPVMPDLWKYSILGDPAKKGSIEWRDYAADCVHSIWDPIRKVHVAYVKSWTWPPNEFGNISPTSDGQGRRLESVTISPDFIHWSLPVRCFVPEPGDVPLIEFGYTFRAKPRGNQMILSSCILNEGISTGTGHGVGFTVLSTTNDLVHCNRMRQPWLDRAADDPKAADRAMAWVADMVTVGDEEYIYYAGYQGGHKNFNDRTMNLARLRKDGFVSRGAGTGWGKLTTPLIRLDAGKMTINAEIRGELRLRVLDQQGEPIAGFRENEIDAVRGNSTAHLVKTRAELTELKGRPIQFEFSLRNGELFGFELL
jgi:hypothetical protein